MEKLSVENIVHILEKAIVKNQLAVIVDKLDEKIKEYNMHKYVFLVSMLVNSKFVYNCLRYNSEYGSLSVHIT